MGDLLCNAVYFAYDKVENCHPRITKLIIPINL